MCGIHMPVHFGTLWYTSIIPLQRLHEHLICLQVLLILHSCQELSGQFYHTVIFLIRDKVPDECGPDRHQAVACMDYKLNCLPAIQQDVLCGFHRELIFPYVITVFFHGGIVHILHPLPKGGSIVMVLKGRVPLRICFPHIDTVWFIAVFIKASFPYELESASHEYLRLNLRDQVASQIPIDVPEKGDYRFHLETDNDES